MFITDMSKKKVSAYLIAVLFLCALGIGYVLLAETQEKLVVSFLDVGQGDSIYIKAPNGFEVLLDAGAGKRVLSELGGVMPFYDKDIDLIIASHPDADHIGGFIEVLKRYRVRMELEPGVGSDTSFYEAFQKEMADEGLERVLARKGMDIVLDKKRNIYIRILFPDRDVVGMETNDASIVAKLIYGNTSVMLTGDSPQKIENHLLETGRASLDSDILKAGHHGSRTSTGAAFVEAVSPAYTIISAGKGNRYGHPHKEVLDILNAYGSLVLRTDESGRITFESDGKEWKKK